MTSAPYILRGTHLPLDSSIRVYIDSVVDNLITALPRPASLSSDQRRGIIARYTAVLEGNFIYWMTAAYLAVKSEEARSIILENLHEEVRDCHPGMLRRFAVAAGSAPTDSDFHAISQDLKNVRLFLGRLSGVRNVITMAFFEGFIQRFMAFLGEIAGLQGSQEQEYTVVHGVCDIAHTQELYRALEAEMSLNSAVSEADLFEGVEALRALMGAVLQHRSGRIEAAWSAGATCPIEESQCFSSITFPKPEDPADNYTGSRSPWTSDLK